MSQRGLLRFAVGVAIGTALALMGAKAVAQGTAQPTNDLPNQYRTIANYFKLPEGRTWGSTNAGEVDKDGKSILVAERCGAKSCLD